MKNYRFITNLFFYTITALLTFTVQATPNGPWINPNQNISLQAYMSYEELTRQLIRISGQSKGKMVLESAATTGQGRTVWLAKIGNPDKTPVMIITQQHGDEPHGTEAVLEIIKTLAASNGKTSKAILDELYVLVVPRVNPDGAVLPTRGNTDFSAPPRNSADCFDNNGDVDPALIDQGRGVYTTSYTQADGSVVSSYDINRYHWSDWSTSWQILCNPNGAAPHYDAALSPVPEAQGVVNAYKAYQPIWVIDVHNQGFNVINEDDTSGVNRPGRRVTGSILWPTNEDVNEQAVNLSKQLTLVMKKRSLELGNMEFTRYNGGTFPGIARNAYGLIANERIDAGESNVGGSVLVEIMGQIEGSGLINIGQKAIGMLRNNAREILMSVLNATADGSLYEENPTDVDALILDNDQFDRNPHLE